MTEDPRISEIRAVLDEWDTNVEATHRGGLEAVRRVLDHPAPAPRVFFPGDTVPAGVHTMGDEFTVFTDEGEPWSPVHGEHIEITLPTREEWQAAVDRARDARADAEWQHTEGTNP